MHSQLIKLTHPRLHRLNSTLANLEDRQRIALYLRFWESQSIREIAYFLKISWSEADQLIDSTLAELRTEIEKGNELAIVA